MAQETKLPTPATYADMYANAIVGELRKLNANLTKLANTLAPAESEKATGEVSLREPEKKTTHRDARQAATRVADDAEGPVTVVTKEPGKQETVDVVETPSSASSGATAKVPKRD